MKNIPLDEVFINELIRYINLKIDFLYKEEEYFGITAIYHNLKCKINGMIDILSIITDKDYTFDAEGLHEISERTENHD